MLPYCLKCRKNTENVDPKLLKTKNKNSRTMLLSECAVCGRRESRFMKEQQASRFLSSLGTKTPLSKIPLLGKILFQLC